MDSADIVQIATKAGDSEFSIYVTPTQNIGEEAPTATKLTNIGPKLFYNNLGVETLSISKAFQALKYYLKRLGKKYILIAHNGSRFDHASFVRTIESEKLVKDFQEWVAGFADSLYLLKAAFPEWAGEGGLKLGRMAKDLLNVTGNFPEAMFDVKILEKLCYEFIENFDILKKMIKFDHFIKKKVDQKLTRSKLPDLS